MDKPWLRSYEPVVPATLEFPESDLYRVFSGVVREFPNNTAVRLILSYLLGGRYTVGTAITYAELSNKVERFANAL